MKQNRIFTALSAGLIITAACSLFACRTAGTEANASMQLRETRLSSREMELIGLVSTGKTKIFDYQLDENAAGIWFTLEEYKDGKLTILAEAGGEAPESGRFAVNASEDKIMFSWNDGNYTADVNTTKSYRSSITSFSSSVLKAKYNVKQAVGMIVSKDSEKLSGTDVSLYENLLGLDAEKYDRMLFFTVAFTDFPIQEGCASYNRMVRDRSQLSEDTLGWLERYNTMPLLDQLALSSFPREFADPYVDTIDAEAGAPAP